MQENIYEANQWGTAKNNELCHETKTSISYGGTYDDEICYEMFQLCFWLMHTFPHVCAVMSENYIVFIEQPIKLDLLKFMLYRIQGKSFHKVMTWEPQYETIFHLVNRHTGKVG